MAAAGAGSSIVTINVGGQIFQTTQQTLSLAGPNSFLSSLIPSGDSHFIDRDPTFFSSLLAVLRSSRPLSSSSDLEDLAAEADFYGIDPQILLGRNPQFRPFSIRRSLSLPINGRDLPTAISVHTTSGAVLVSHGGKITSFDWSLRRRSTVLTRFPAVDSLLAISPSAAAAGAADFPSLRVVDLATGAASKVLDWDAAPPSGSSSGNTVQAIGASPELLFASFESPRRTANAIVAFDMAAGGAAAAEIGRREIYGADIDSAIPATKLSWVPSFKLLMASGSHGGPSGLMGNLRLWDVRAAGVAVWESTEREDCFVDAAASDELSAVFKVGVSSGEVFMADLRKLASAPGRTEWVCLGDASRAARGRREGSGRRVECYGGHVFVSKGCDLEMWTEVPPVESRARAGDVGAGERVMRRNLMGRAKDDAGGGKMITGVAFGADRMVVMRKEEHSVEVWEGNA